ncbi:PepSY-like domain-containing protein [Brachyspira hyodysenteriae]|uniref:PepSY-like domain-containing protein n=1 Tax=Brachyspira hyodysenteriae TaxID=159 RepID=UPI001BFECD19|nr:PepSY-like domain-containing protein [Brachyspira hyodysenteriae]MBT8754579.1 PepSY-like domain-containing protein [Brachyspira hyodysenteriae]
MKILKVILTIMIISSGSLFADDWIVSPEQLPQRAKQFIAQVFPDAQIWYVEMDDGKYEVELSNGIKIDFLGNGDWKEIDAEYIGIPYNVFPANVANTIRNTYPQTVIISAEKKWGTYEIKLNNMMELYISSNGQLIGQKFDD